MGMTNMQNAIGNGLPNVDKFVICKPQQRYDF